MNGVILTASRGAMLAMVAAGLGAIVFSPRRRRALIWSGGALGIVLFVLLAQSATFWERAGTNQILQR